MSWWSRMVNAFRRDSLDNELLEEMEFHVEMRTREGVAAGLSPEEAAREARRSLGADLRQRERSHDLKLNARLESIVRDIRMGLRLMRKNPVFSGAAVLSLGLAIGANTSAFSLIEALILRPLPVNDPQSLYSIASPHAFGEQDAFSYPVFQNMRQAVGGRAELMLASYPAPHALLLSKDTGETRKVWRQMVSGNFFSTLGVPPQLGRVLTPSDDVTPGAHPVAVISDDFWTRQYHRDPRIIGRWLTLDHVDYQIIGVARAGFTGIEPGTYNDIWLPSMMWDRAALSKPGWSWFRVLIRPAPGNSIEQIRQMVQVPYRQRMIESASRMPVGTPPAEIERRRNSRIVTHPAGRGLSSLRKTYAQALWILGGLVFLVLVIACANVGNLLLARTTARGREMALRLSLGAGGGRLIQQVLIESAMIAIGGTLVGLMLSRVLTPTILTMMGDSTRLDLRLNWPVLAFLLAVTGGATLLFGLAPALRASTTRPAGLAGSGSRLTSRHRFTQVMLACQVGFSFVVLFGAGLFLRTFYNVTKIDTGYDQRNVVLFSLHPMKRDAATGVDGKAQTQAVIRADEVLAMQREIQQIAGVSSAAGCSFPLLSGNAWTEAIRLPGQAIDTEEPFFLAITPGFLKTMRLPLLEGREWKPQDTRATDLKPAIVNQTFARHFFNGQSPIGRVFEIPRNDDGKAQRFTIVGSVRDALYNVPRAPARSAVYVPMEDETYASLAVRLNGPASAAIPAIRQQIVSSHPGVEVTDIDFQEELFSTKLRIERLLAVLSSFFATVALVLAGIGLYSVINYTVVERTREIGIRMALGSSKTRVIRLVASQGFLAIVMGLLFGAAASTGLMRVADSILYGVKVQEALSFLLPLSGLLVACAVALALPAWRASRVEPSQALRYD